MDSDFIEYLCRDSDLIAATTCRGADVVASDAYSGFSVCGYTGDDEAHYSACRRRLAAELGLHPGCIVMPRQTHSAEVLVTDGEIPPADELYGVDALVTSARGLVIGVNTADCVPLVMADRRAGVIGAVHAGWRGAVAGVQVRALHAMLGAGAVPGDIRVWMGPCICEGCFEVGDEVAQCFPDAFVVHEAGRRKHVQLAGYVASTLADCGVPEGNIALPCGCTRCRTDRYFSARASGVASGRNFTFIYRP